MKIVKTMAIVILIMAIVAVGGCRRGGSVVNVNEVTIGVADFMAGRNILPNPEVGFSTTDEMLEALRAGEIDVAYVHLNAADEADFEGFDYFLIGRMPIAFVGTMHNPVDNITREQLIGIMRGEITNWADVGGHDEPIYVGVTIAEWFNLAIGASVGTEIVPNNENITHGWIDNVFAFDVFDRIILGRLGNNDVLKPIAIDGILPNLTTISSGNYPFMINVYAVIYSGGANNDGARLHVLNTLDNASRDIDMLTFVGRSPYAADENAGFVEFWNSMMEFRNQTGTDYEVFDWASLFE